jgi:hypothetical protein
LVVAIFAYEGIVRTANKVAKGIYAEGVIEELRTIWDVISIVWAPAALREDSQGGRVLVERIEQS